ncbi:MAG: GNAT family N-acetyltransferase [Defluviitaleaceae bacterium]|nr:GNAT family N-acetyltransferase [Defluviitaleaceae bacterium]
MTIRKTAAGDLPAVMDIYAGARDFMRDSGNPGQWGEGYPSLEMIERDIADGKSYVCVDKAEIAAVFYFGAEREPTYAKIDGAWLNDGYYGVVHRIARAGNAKGAAAFCVEWCLEQCGNVRIDTHRDNAPMRGLLERLGFVYCGVIWLANGDERLAYQKARS